MKNAVLFFAFICFSLPLAAAEIADADIGTYVILDQNRAPTDIFYRLSKNANQWAMEGKNAEGEWTVIHCETGCEYRPSTEAEIQAYFPADWVEKAEIACIQNIAQAFCRYAAKSDLSRGGHIIIALVTEKPTPIYIKRVQNQTP